jgi:hypothetical protein
MADALHYIPGRAALLVEVASDDGKLGVGESAIYGGSASVTEALNAGSRCADRRSRRSLTTVGAGGIRSTGPLVCVLAQRLGLRRNSNPAVARGSVPA